MVFVTRKVQVVQVGLRGGVEPQRVNTRAMVAILLRVLVGFGNGPIDRENGAVEAVFPIASPGTLMA
jgi:hypothetical protein